MTDTTNAAKMQYTYYMRVQNPATGSKFVIQGCYQEIENGKILFNGEVLERLN